MSDRDELAALIHEVERPGVALSLTDGKVTGWHRPMPKDPPLWGECPRCGASVDAVCQERGGLVEPHKERPRIAQADPSPG